MSRLTTTSDLQQAAQERQLTLAKFQLLAAVPAAVEWFVNINTPPHPAPGPERSERVCGFVGLTGTEELRAVIRVHVLAWRAQLDPRGMAGATIRRTMAALATLFNHLLEIMLLPAATPFMA